MRIVQITPGAGDSFYCENCLRDHATARALRDAGHDVMMVPLYLPAYSDAPETDLRKAPLFFGGINVYLQQKLALFRHTPRWLDRLFDADGLLRWAGRKTGMTRAKDLGETTISMLRGEHGRQGKELRRLTDWLTQQDAVDVVLLSNAMLLGLAEPIREALGAPVVCFLQDEEPFVDALIEPYRSQAWALIGERARGVEALVAVSNAYADRMAPRLGVPREQVHVVHLGVDVEGYEPAEAAAKIPTVGFLSQMCHAKGLDLLIEAFVRLKRAGHETLRLRVAGGKTDADEPFLAELHRRLAREGLAEHVEFLNAFDREAKAQFLPGLHVLCVPSRDPEAFGLFVLEALACGVPVALPAHGAFEELIDLTGGGVTFGSEDVDDLTRTLADLLTGPERARAMGRAGRQAVIDRFRVQHTAENLTRLCEQVAQAHRKARTP